MFMSIMNFKLFNESYEFEDFTMVDMDMVEELYNDGLTDLRQISIEMDMDIETVEQIINTLKRRGDIFK